MEKADSSPSLDEWRRLYEAAIRFRDAAPWTYMEELDLFGVQDPESGEIGYCCILGNAGEMFALAVYRGSEGLAGYWRLRDEAFIESMTMEEALALQDCLMASFGSRDEIEPRDREVIKSLGLKFRGATAWPLFRSYRPGFVPWFLTAPEARFLTVALEQAMDVAERFYSDAKLLPHASKKGQYLVRVPEKTDSGGSIVWRDERQRPKSVPPRRVPAAPSLSEEMQQEARRLAQTLPRAKIIVELDYFYAPTPIKGNEEECEEERPYFPYIVLAGDARSGAILGFGMAPPKNLPGALSEAFLEIITGAGENGMLPAAVRVRRREATAYLEPLLSLLGVPIEQVKELPAIEEAQFSLSAFMGLGF